MSAFNHATETRLFVTVAIVACVILLPAWGQMHHGEPGYEPGLAMAGVLATIVTMYGSLSACHSWSFCSFFFAIPWMVFGTISCTALAIGMLRSASIGWHIGLELVTLLQLLALCLPAILWLIDERQAAS